MKARPLLVTPSPANVPGAWYDQAAVDRVVRFLRTLKHVKGRWGGVAFDPAPWQVEYLIGPVFGWKHPDGTRIVRTAWWEFPRKQGKSSLASGLGLYLLAADREPGAEVYAAAGAKDQAGMVFEPSRQMALAAPALRKRLKVHRGAITYPATASTFKVLASDAKLLHGLNVHGAVIDEVHVHRTRELIDTLETGTGSREQPLVLFITTADEGEQTSIYAEKRGYVEQLAAGTVTDPSTYGVVFAARPDDDPFDEATWERANPGIDVTVKRSYLRKEAAKAQALPSYLPTFKRLHLGIRTRTEERWFDLAKWDAGASLVTRGRLQGRECYAGLDLASTSDFTAWVLLFPPEVEGGPVQVLPRFWLPAAAVARREALRATLETWTRQGFMTLTDGDVVDEDAIKAGIAQDAEDFRILDLGYDPWNATGIVLWAADRGLTVSPVSQGIARLNQPSKKLEALVMGERIQHGGHPVLRWMADNVRKDEDSNGNVKPSKKKSTEKIDGIAALVNAIERWLAGMAADGDADPFILGLDDGDDQDSDPTAAADTAWPTPPEGGPCLTAIGRGWAVSSRGCVGWGGRRCGPRPPGCSSWLGWARSLTPPTWSPSRLGG